MQFLRPQDDFPPVEESTVDGLVAYSLDLSPQRLLQAYNLGIFPWYEEGQPVLWWSPDPRMVLFPENLRISRSMRQLLRKNAFEVSFNKAFSEVMANCAKIERPGQAGTWITKEMEEVYRELHEMEIATSVEVWKEGELVGGLYGIYLREKKIFCGESMFSKMSNASKYGFVHLVQELQKEGVQLIDCQVFTSHLASLGADEIPRQVFLEYLK